MKSKYIELLNTAGQVVWYDNLSRDVLDDGSLAQLIKAGVSGLTSNPTIFQKALASSPRYDDSIRQLRSKESMSADSVCEQLFVQDVGRAADLLLPVYEATEGRDGFASLEVSPELAFNTTGTIEAALRLWKMLKRPNVMIKVPATKEGVLAIQTLLENGINLNITLIFSVQRYREVVNAYVQAMKNRKAAHKPVDRIASVASFFVSRVDSMVTKKLGKEDAKFLGKVSVANCRLAYETYKEVFLSPDFLAVGARSQKPLWASTGVKSTQLNPTYYVEQLIAPNTVETLPPQTLDAIMNGLSINSLEKMSLESARQTIAELEVEGIKFNELLDELMVEGVALFAESYADLLKGVSAKMDQLK